MSEYMKLKTVELKKLCADRGIDSTCKTRGELVRLLQNEIEDGPSGGSERTIVTGLNDVGNNGRDTERGPPPETSNKTSETAETQESPVRSRNNSATSIRSTASSHHSQVDENLRLKLELSRLELESKRLQFEQEKHLKEMEQEKHLREIELEKHRLQLEHEFRMRPLNTSQPTGESASNIGTNSIDVSKLIPRFNEQKDQMDLFLQSFEKVCKLHDIPANQWAYKLPPLLAGKSLAVYSRLSEELSRDYESIKQSLLAAYRITPEQYKIRFRAVKREDLETYSETASRLKETLDAWTKSKDADSMDTLLELFAIEQFEKNLPSELITWLRDRAPNSVAEAARLADEYTANRANVKKERVDAADPETSTPTHGSYGRTEQSVRAKGNNPPYPSVEGRTPARVTCYYCSKTGHYMANCSLRQRDESSGDNRPVNRVERSHGTSVKSYETTIHVGSEKVTALRDTGADLTLVHGKWINPEDFTGKCVYVRQPLDEAARSIPLAKVELTIGKETITQEVGVAPFLDTDVLWGNDIDIEFDDLPKLLGRGAKKRALENARNLEENAAPAPTKPNPGVIIAQASPPQLPPGLHEISPQEFADLQRVEPSLAPLFKDVDAPHMPGKAKVYIKQGLLYCDWVNARRSLSPPWIQLVVPRKCRAKAAKHISVTHDTFCSRHYLFGAPFTFMTDHNPLRYLHSMSNSNPKLMRWSLILGQLDFNIQYKKGTENKNADALSRIELDLLPE